MSGRIGLIGGLTRRESEADVSRALLERLPDPVAALDGAARLRFGNAAFRGLVGPLATSLVPLVPEPEAAAFGDALDSAQAGAAVLAFPLTLLLPTGRAEFTAALDPLPVSGLVLLRLRAAAEDAQGADAQKLAALGRLAGGVAHDFNNLLTGVMGATTHVLESVGDPALQEELRQVLAAARRGADLVRQLLAFSSQQRLAPRVVSINEAVEGIARLLRRVLGAGIRLAVELDEPARSVRVDPGQLDQVIVNLVINARDAMPRGGQLRLTTGHATLLRPSRIGAHTIPAGRWVTLAVGDTGDGIPPEVLPRIFEPFFTTRRDRGGTGLGLATVLGIVRQSGGEVTVESTPGRGTTFTVWLPRHAGSPEAEAVAKPPPAEPAPRAAVAQLLLVEDEAPLRGLAERALRRAGHEVTAAEDAAAALACLAEGFRPDLLVSDVSMPGMDGASLAREVRGRLPGVGVLLTSGYAESMVGEQFQGAGFRFLAKPYSPRDLLDAVDAALPS